MSHKCRASETNWSAIEKEAFASLYPLQKLDQCLYDSEFVIRTDHKPLKYIMDFPVQNKKIQHWTTKILGYNYKIRHIECKKNVCADMLSCLPHRPSNSNGDNELSGPDITDKTFEVSMINSSNIYKTLKIPPQHSGVIPIQISGPIIKTHVAYFLTDDSTPKGRDPNINIISGIHKIKGKTSVNVLVSNYTNKHLKFHKGEYIGHLQPAIMHDNTTDQQETHQTNSVTLKKMMSETVTPDTFNPPLHELSTAVQNDLDLVLWEYESQFAKDETSIGTTPLTSMTIDTGTSEPVSQKPYPIATNDCYSKGF